MYVRNSFILTTVFILISGFFFLTPVETSYAQPSDCCFANGGVGCDNVTCETAVCAIDDFCCSVAWDGICAGEAFDLCGELCTEPPEIEGCCTGLGEFPDACNILTERECVDSGGTYQGDGTNCNSFNQCFVRPIPTMSEWGMIGTAGILGLIGLVYLLSRKRRALS
jgi:exosortase sorting signal-containing protein